MSKKNIRVLVCDDHLIVRQGIKQILAKTVTFGATDAPMAFKDLQKNGLALKKGDLVSVGSFSKLLPPKPGKIEAQYQGLPGNPTVTVLFK